MKALNNIILKTLHPIQSRMIGIMVISCLAQLLWAGAVHAADIRVSAAASLTDVLTELAGLYEQEHPDTNVKVSFAGSSTLAKQIENGAPADIFISADKDWADYLQERKLLRASSRVDLLNNALVIIAPLNRNPRIQLDNNFAFADEIDGKLCTGETSHVPAGKYAKQALTYYGWWKATEPHIVGTDDVRTALAFVERGECALGIVYQTDALMSKHVKIVQNFPRISHKPIVYPGALTPKAGEDAQHFWAFLQSVPAQAVFQRYGFLTNHNADTSTNAP